MIYFSNQMIRICFFIFLDIHSWDQINIATVEKSWSTVFFTLVKPSNPDRTISLLHLWMNVSSFVCWPFTSLFSAACLIIVFGSFYDALMIMSFTDKYREVSLITVKGAVCMCLCVVWSPLKRELSLTDLAGLLKVEGGNNACSEHFVC